MSAARLFAEVTVPFFAVMLCLAPAVTRPTVPFGVRVPPERARATVIRHERHAYYWRTAVIGACCIVAAVLLQDYGSWWLTRIILLLEVAGDLGCFSIARKPWRPGPTVTTTGFWKAGLIYLNRDDPAIMVGARFGVGWPGRLPRERRPGGAGDGPGPPGRRRPMGPQ
jgi:uncharacterized membrane protein